MKTHENLTTVYSCVAQVSISMTSFAEHIRKRMLQKQRKDKWKTTFGRSVKLI